MGNARDSYVLSRMRVEGMPRVYVLGCRAQRVTVQSQQYRAFNLIWALFQSGRLNKGDRVGVVGGGIGGLTVAAAAMLKECRVTVAEEDQAIMHMQRRNGTRLLHPNVYDWPASGSEIEATTFPCMNWSADFAGPVVERLHEEWADFESRFCPDVTTRTKVTHLETADDAGRLRMINDNWRSDPCDVVVIAVGFGAEQPVPGIDVVTYWKNDELEQSTQSFPTGRRVLVSGLGDGACIDVLRLKYVGFDHRKFVSAVMKLPELDRCKKQLLRIDLKLDPQISEDEQSLYYRDQYASAGLPADLAQRLGVLRHDTHVILNGPYPAPYSARACLLHRMAIWALQAAGRLEYKAGRLELEKVELKRAATGISYWVPFPNGGGEHRFDKLVIRHGPRGGITGLSEVEKGYKGILENPVRDRTRKPLYPGDFYPTKSFPPTSHNTLAPITSPTQLASAAAAAGDLVVPTMSGVEKTQVAVQERTPTRVTQIPLPGAGEVELVIRTLETETRARNFLQAQDAAVRLDELISSPDVEVMPQVWQRANESLWDFEMFMHERVESSGGKHDLSRAKLLIERMESGKPSAP